MPPPLQITTDFILIKHHFTGYDTISVPVRAVHDIFDLLGSRWALRIVWELRRDALGFTELRGRCGASPSVLSTRLVELSEAGVIERDSTRRYLLSGSGRQLARLLYEMNRWAEASKHAPASAA
jgi:DNA-binding HxlR family transcriptional regulator